MRPIFVRFLVLAFFISLPAAAQLAPRLEPSLPAYSGPVDMTAYGTTSLTVDTLAEFSFVPFISSMTYEWNDGLYLTTGGFMIGQLRVPTGSHLILFQLEACDDSDAGQARLELAQCSQTLGCSFLGEIGTGIAETPGCGTFSFAFPAPVVVENNEARYLYQYTNGDVFDGTVRFSAARMGYLRQISPAPGTATFDDVPTTHPLFQFVEALVASGITAGCDADNFCPNAPLTRGQMAVFLAKALGLHWPL